MSAIKREKLFQETLESDLFQECVLALSDSIKILSLDETDKIFDIFEGKLLILAWGRIDWNNVPKKSRLERSDEIIPTLEKLLGRKNFDTSIYVLWGEASIPVVETDLNLVLSGFNDVISVAPDTWLINFKEGYVIEIFHDGEMAVGLIPKDI